MKRKMMYIVSIAAIPLAACASTPGNSSESSENFPENLDSIEVIVPFGAGGSTDTVARLVAPRLEEILGVPVQVLNKPEANGQRALQELADAPTDGSVIGSTNLPSVFTTYLDPNTEVAYTRESFQTIGSVTTFGSVLVTRSDSGIDSLDDLADLASDRPGQVTLAAGAVDDLIPTTALEEATQATFNHIPYEGGSTDKVTALLGDKVDLIIAAPSAVVANVDAGELQVIANLGSTRSVTFPDVPTATEQGYDIVEDTINGFSLPAGAPEDIIEAYNQALDEVVQDATFAEAVEPLGFNAEFLSAQDFADRWNEREEQAAPILGGTE